MKIKLRADTATGVHTRVAVFIDGANCGNLCMLEADAVTFHDVVLYGCGESGCEFKSEGRWWLEKR